MVFKDRVSQFPNRRTLTEVSTGVYNVSRQEGIITEGGTPLNAENLNMLVQKSGVFVTDNLVSTANGALGSIKNSGISQANVVTQTANGVLDQIAVYAGANKTLKTGGAKITDLSVYDRIIRTQAEFNALIANSTWFGAVSVAFVGQFTLSTANNSGVKIPQTVKQIHGYNGAKITITNFLYNTTTAKGGMWYDTKPLKNSGYEIQNLHVDCTNTAGAGAGIGFALCSNLINCDGTGTASGSGNGDGAGYSACSTLINCTGIGVGTDRAGAGFINCSDLINCTGIGTSTGTTSGSKDGFGFFMCDSLTNCDGTGTRTGTGGGFGYGFSNCTQLTNCTGTATGRSSSYGFSNCTQLTNCTGTATGSKGYGFYSIDTASNCRQGGTPSTTAIWGGNNRNIDTASCEGEPTLTFTVSTGTHKYDGYNIGDEPCSASGTAVLHLSNSRIAQVIGGNAIVYVTNCTGALQVMSNTCKVYITASPSLTISGITVNNWRNVYADGVAEWVNSGTVTLLSGNSTEGQFPNWIAPQTGEYCSVQVTGINDCIVMKDFGAPTDGLYRTFVANFWNTAEDAYSVGVRMTDGACFAAYFPYGDRKSNITFSKQTLRRRLSL